MIEEIIEELSECSEVEAVALGGSRGRGTADKDSDYDIYVYTRGKLAVERRREILEKYCRYIEAGNTFWEEEDDCILNNGTDMELIYRRIEDIEGNMKSVVDEGRASMGYTTCFWDNLINSRILYDEGGRLTKLAERYRTGYPEELKKNIIEKNHRLLKDYMPSLYYQVEKAVKRGDLISINHRLAEFLAIYFDIIYAVNEEPHRGEKRMLETSSKFEHLPEEYSKLIEAIFTDIYRDNNRLLKTLDRICQNLYTLLRRKGYGVSADSYRCAK